MPMHESRHDHIQAVMEWLQKNVRFYPIPSSITLQQIRLDRKELKGEALLLIGDARPGEELSLWMSETGWLTFSPPLFHSPLGAPATYGAIELTKSTEEAIDAAVRSLLPRLLPLGLNRKTGDWVTIGTPLRERIVDVSEFDVAFEKITGSDFELVRSIIPS